MKIQTYTDLRKFFPNNFLENDNKNLFITWFSSFYLKPKKDILQIQ